MKTEMASIYRCPYTVELLRLSTIEDKDGEVTEGKLISASGLAFSITSGIPHFIAPDRETFSDAERREISYYQEQATSYDKVIDWLFKSFYESEDVVRERMIDGLELKPGFRVLETGCGTCRDSFRIARRLGAKGTLFLQDLSPEMIQIGRERMEQSVSREETPAIEYFVGNAVRLPFPDSFFDAAFHFGGFNLFSDKVTALKEMTRVVRPGCKIIVGDESLGPWLRETTYGKILLNSNKLYQFAVPIEALPDVARDVCVRWLLGNAFYVIEFRVGQGVPEIDLDLPITGKRGGTHRTRYYGQLEGVTPEAKAMVEAAAAQEGVSLHGWLDRAIRCQFADEQNRQQKK